MDIHEEYEAPEIRTVGSVADITQANTVGTHFDANFVVTQPIPPNFRGS